MSESVRWRFWEAKAGVALQEEGKTFWVFSDPWQGLQGQEGAEKAEGVGSSAVPTALLAGHEASQRRSCHSCRKSCQNYPTGQE